MTIITERFPMCDICDEIYADTRYEKISEVRDMIKRDGWKCFKGKDICENCVENGKDNQ